ncbi:hypothetical protein, partial [Bordetella pertussis]|uniref:hypothetical protein n=1 Tax=Bordetella pertussis TaxID=520 RepID=UPI001C9E3A7F
MTDIIDDNAWPRQPPAAQNYPPRCNIFRGRTDQRSGRSAQVTASHRAASAAAAMYTASAPP